MNKIQELIEQFENANVGEGTTFEASDHRLVPNGYFEEWALEIETLYTLAQEMAEALAVAWRATDPFALERPQVLQIQEALTKWAEFKK